ncbi:hypothetical protein TH63_13525 [Rufibacter radiotolerans]|uniref:Uncharacterized protein n=1 Tax=Rufibacter radiotolerans TaxID=1379910 RepID=A0A0H4VR46_9BACT|nr:hypothetical protein [Rufibacter radiotolerans]AKQ46412.1 hypothetical protein TH63_13525 [Rufibacter radiotolerans]
MSQQQETALLEYFKLYKLLEEKGGPERDGDLFEEVLGKEEDILQSFGVPASMKHLQILHKLVNRKSVTVASIQKAIAQLQKAAEVHLSAPVLTDLEFLKKAKEEDLSAYDVLPELGIITHTYPIFLMEVALTFIDPQVILDEFYALKRLDCNGDLYRLKNKHPKSYRRTKIYKQLKPYLKFIDQYVRYNPDLPVQIEDWLEEEKLDVSEIISYKDDIAEPIRGQQPSLFDEPALTKPPIDFTPEYTVLTDLVMVEEITFSRDSGVTVSGHLAQYYRPTRLMLGFEFDKFYEVLSAYFSPGLGLLSYFNKNRQQAIKDEPVIINVQDKLGKPFVLGEHYFRVYKPEALDRAGNAVPMEEDFYIVEEVIDRARYDQQEAKHIKSNLLGWFHKMKNHYYVYENHKRNGLNEQEAKKEIGLEDDIRFAISKLLYELDKHGGKLT